MAKDDYEVIVYRILIYLYACMKRKIIFDETVFRKTVRRNVEDDSYFTDIIRLIQSEGLIENVAIICAWGNEYIIASDLADMSITASGIRYLKENSRMKQIGEMLKESADMMVSLATKVGLFI